VLFVSEKSQIGNYYFYLFQEIYYNQITNALTALINVSMWYL